jgi:hypothetical protein
LLDRTLQISTENVGFGMVVMRGFDWGACSRSSCHSCHSVTPLGYDSSLNL